MVSRSRNRCYYYSQIAKSKLNYHFIYIEKYHEAEVLVVAKKYQETEGALLHKVDEETTCCAFFSVGISLRFYDNIVLVKEERKCVWIPCSLPHSQSTAIPKYRIKDFKIGQRNLCSELCCIDRCPQYSCCVFPVCCCYDTYMLTLELSEVKSASIWQSLSGKPYIYFHTKTPIDVGFMEEYTYGPMMQSMSKLHVINHLIEDGLSEMVSPKTLKDAKVH